MEATVTEAQRAAPPPRLRERYEAEIVARLRSRFGYRSRMQVPTLEKITLNMGVGEAKQTTPILEAATDQLAVIAGQRPSVRRARKSIAAFKVRAGMPVGVAVTLRGARMWEFLDRLTSIAIPLIRQFRGLDVTITTTAATDEEGFELLLALGMPFAEEGRPGTPSVEEEAEAEEERRKEEARARAEAEQAALEQLKAENPEAYERREREEEPEEGEETERES